MSNAVDNGSGKQTVMIIGLGTMGSGIVVNYALGGHPVLAVGRTADHVVRGQESAGHHFEYLVTKGLYTAEQVAQAQGLISWHTQDELPQIAAQADIVTETISEDPAKKCALFELLVEHCRPDAILTSNTSGMDIFSVLSEVMPDQSRLVITHWFNLPYVMRLVEVVMGPGTSEETAQTMLDVLAGIGKKPSLLRKFVPGFIANRFAQLILREASQLVEAGVASPQDIDSILSNLHGVRFAFEGPFRMFDVIGWDLIAKTANIYDDLSNFRGPDPTAAKQVASGDLGLKSGKGIYDDYADMDPVEYANRRSDKVLAMYRAIDALEEL